MVSIFFHSLSLSSKSEKDSTLFKFIDKHFPCLGLWSEISHASKGFQR